MDFDKTDTLVGAFVVGAVLVFVSAFVAVNRARFVAETYHLEIRLPEISGIDKGVEVVYKGYKAGVVDRVTVVYVPEFRFVVRLAIKSEIQLRRGTICAVRNRGFAGGKSLELVAPDRPEAGMLAEGEILPTTRDTDLMAKANEVLGEAQKVVRRFQEHGTAEEAIAVVKAARQVVNHLDDTLVSVRALVEEDRTALKATLEQTKSLTERSNGILDRRGPNLERSLQNLDQSLVHLPAILVNLEELTADLKKHPWRLVRKGDEAPPKLEHNHESK
ncbi:MAG: MCE family protein [Elusimicrobia bacterium]|nr:MCE family protein [Elusimicrobiota bacterium]